ncbi:MAG: efflux RND transporter periplasmic adaptor subunit [Lachnospiraceae bacterium]|nr:efflux RND transporter periplasmic adaptor subunit [Lachnospiraceae bacterium]
MKTKKGIKGISLLMAASLIFSGCSSSETIRTEEEAEETAAIAVKAAEAERGTLTISNEFVGTVSAQQEVSIIPLVSGEVDAVYFEVGDEVQAGDVLFHIDDEAAKLQEESARLQRQSIDNSAKMQLGSAQVMSNISMQSNIKSLEFQIQSAKDQYDSAVQGIVDAEEAKEEIAEALSQIDASVNSLKADQGKRESVINTARQYIKAGEWEVAYTREQTPDQLTWGTPESEPESEDTPESESGGSPLSNIINSLTGTGTTSLEDTAPSETQKELSEAEADNTAASEAAAAAEQVQAEESSEADMEEPSADGAGAPDMEESSADAGGDEQNGIQSRQSDDGGTGGKMSDINGMTAGVGAYYSAETERNAEGVYFAFETRTVPSQTVSIEEAWDAYNRQQEINAAKAAAESMGYDAKDIADGTATKEMLEISAQIVSLEYQASELRSSQSTIDSSISQAETAKDTTAKTIDFYEDNLKDAQTTYGIQNGQAYQDTADALATQQQSADVAIKSAQLQLEYYSPATPISGKVISKSVELYGMTQAGYAAYVISNQDAMNVTFLVSCQVKANLTVGMPITILKNGDSFSGTITEIGQAVEQQSGGLFSVKAVTETGGDILASGTAVKLRVDTFKAENAVIIPYDAVHFESEQAYVFVIQDGILVRTPVTLGLMNDDNVEVTEGLEAGSQVVSTWSSQLEDGVAVRIIGEAKE